MADWIIDLAVWFIQGNIFYAATVAWSGRCALACSMDSPSSSHDNWLRVMQSDASVLAGQRNMPFSNRL